MNNKKEASMKVFLSLLFTLVLAACASPASGPQFQALQPTDSAKAVLYFYRTPNYSNRATRPHVYIDGVDKGLLQDGGYYVYTLEPGKRVLEIRGDPFMWSVRPMVVETTLQANTRYFFRLKSTRFVGGIEHQIHQLDEPDALAELRYMKLSQDSQ
jgi:hypothetical protein